MFLLDLYPKLIVYLRYSLITLNECEKLLSDSCQVFKLHGKWLKGPSALQS